MTGYAWFFIGFIIYLLIGIILRDHSPWGKKWYSEKPTLFTLFWIVPATGTTLFYVALTLALIFLMFAVVGIVITVLFNSDEKVAKNMRVEDRFLWGDVLEHQLNKIVKKFSREH